MNNNNKRTVIIIAIMALLCLRCRKEERGYLSDHIYYVTNPFSVSQGVTTVSESLIANGSTTPLTVTLLGITDMATGKKMDDVFLTPRTMQVYRGAITYADSTVNGLRSKLADSTVAPFSINTIGGRLQFTGTTTFVPQGTYSLDVSVSNIRDTKTFNNICTINIVPTEFFVQTGTAYGYLLDTITQGRTNISPVVTAVRNMNGEAKIIIKWEDADGKVINPRNGEIQPRDGLPSFQNWDPYYKVELTDTALVYQYPDHVPLFPVFNPAIVNGTTYTDYWCYYKMPAKFVTEPGQEARVGLAFNFPNAVGTYVVTVHVGGVHRK
jgi:hypothetical protein